jgi:hypothetical protein
MSMLPQALNGADLRVGAWAGGYPSMPLPPPPAQVGGSAAGRSTSTWPCWRRRPCRGADRGRGRSRGAGNWPRPR